MGRFKGGKKQYTSVRLTGLFATKKPGMYVGNARPEDIEALIEKCNEALEQDKKLTFFLFKNQDRDSDMAFSLMADIQRDMETRKSKRSERIDEDDEEQDERPRKKSRRDEDDDEEDEDEKPRRKKKRDDDDEEDL